MSGEEFDLQKHLKEEHKISPFQTYLKEIVYGGNDGIVTTFAVVAGFAGASQSSIGALPALIVLLFGLANLFADAISMALGNFLSLRAEKDVYRSEQAKELHEIRHNPKMEKLETVAILQQKGFSKEQSEKLTEIYAANEKYWQSFMMNYELEMPNPTNENPVYTSFATFLSFVFFGFIPLIPYVLWNGHSNTFLFSTIAAFSALALLGSVRAKITVESPVRSVFEVVVVGGIAAGIAYFVGTFFKL